MHRTHCQCHTVDFRVKIFKQLETMSYENQDLNKFAKKWTNLVLEISHCLDLCEVILVAMIVRKTEP